MLLSLTLKNNYKGKFVLYVGIYNTDIGYELKKN
jgi:hypothetical protein